jgi:hypothetical protein
MISTVKTPKLLLLASLLAASPLTLAQTYQYNVYSKGLVAPVAAEPAPPADVFDQAPTTTKPFATVGLTTFTAPITGTYYITAIGAKGGGASDYSKVGGNGAKISCNVRLYAGTDLKILVGGAGGTSARFGGGGGGSFVTLTDNTPLCVGGGGGGSGGDRNGTASSALGGDGKGGLSMGAAGGGAGGGLTTSGANSVSGAPGGKSLIEGGAAGTGPGFVTGGFGGGGAGFWHYDSPSYGVGGSGGGYSGGNGGTSSAPVGLAGTSFSAQTQAAFVAGFGTGNGSVSISY